MNDMRYAREGYIEEHFLGQIRQVGADGLVTGPWLDYARGTHAASYDWWVKDPGDDKGHPTRRVVDWIRKGEQVHYGQTDAPDYILDPR